MGTMQTHVSRIYRKLGINSKELINLSARGSAADPPHEPRVM
jgi:DNA-binding CsgD family transcriptional regulator